MNKFGKILIYFITSIFFASVIYIVSIDKILPNIEYINKISFQLAYLNYDDFLIVAFKEEQGSDDHSLNKYNITKNNILNDVSIDLPYKYSSSVYFLFGEDNPIDFALANFAINGKTIENSKIADGLQKIGYKVIIRNSVIYAKHTKNVNIGAFDVKNLSDALLYVGEEELSKYSEQDNHLRFFYFLCLTIILLFLLKAIFKHYNFNYKFELLYSLILYVFLFIVAFGLIQKEFFLDQYEDIFYLIKNLAVLIFIPIFVFFVSYKLKINKVFMATLVIAFLIFVGIDHFVQNTFGTRFLYSYVGKFGGNIGDGIPFFVDYIFSIPGLCYILSILTVIAIYTFDLSKIQILSNRLVLTLLCVAFSGTFAVAFIGNDESKHRYLNLFQININGLFSEGDYQREYINYIPYTIEQLEYKKEKGLNQRKNVILVLVESLGCNVTDLCGKDNNFSPYTKELALNNIWFSNYYSNAYHTNGAIFAITTGYTLVGNKDWDKTPINPELYQYDVINNFKNNGYKTAYFSPAPLILGKDKQLNISNYDYLSFNSDKFYEKSKKEGVFNSATDEELFAKIVEDVKSSDLPVFFMTTTISTHTPYIVPWGSHKKEVAYAYSDMAIKKFIQNLKKINYFDNGIVVITSDHVGWGSNNEINLSNTSSKSDFYRIPLIIINGKDHGIEISDVSFSHTSLGVLLEYLMLPNYYQNKYQVNPLLDHHKDEYIIHYDNANMNVVDVKLGDKEDVVLLDGDYTRFLSSKFSAEDQNLILGYLSWVRR